MYSCKFYGKCALPARGVLIPTGGRQCGLFATFRPCQMEIAGQRPDFDLCDMNGSARANDAHTFEDAPPGPTPAPWYADEYRCYAPPDTYTDRRRGRVIVEWKHVPDFNPADGPLIGAAAELLEACETVLAYLDRLEREDGGDPPIVSTLRRQFHAPLRAKLEPAIRKARTREP